MCLNQCGSLKEAPLHLLDEAQPNTCASYYYWATATGLASIGKFWIGLTSGQWPQQPIHLLLDLISVGRFYLFLFFKYILKKLGNGETLWWIVLGKAYFLFGFLSSPLKQNWNNRKCWKMKNIQIKKWQRQNLCICWMWSKGPQAAPHKPFWRRR